MASALNAGNSRVEGLIINGFDDGIVINGPGGDVIAGNWIGVNATGSAAAANRDDGIEVNAPNVVIGGTTAAARNVISGNTQRGIELDRRCRCTHGARQLHWDKRCGHGGRCQWRRRHPSRNVQYRFAECPHRRQPPRSAQRDFRKRRGRRSPPGQFLGDHLRKLHRGGGRWRHADWKYRGRYPQHDDGEQRWWPGATEGNVISGNTLVFSSSAARRIRFRAI